MSLKWGLSWLQRGSAVCAALALMLVGIPLSNDASATSGAKVFPSQSSKRLPDDQTYKEIDRAFSFIKSQKAQLPKNSDPSLAEVLHQQELNLEAARQMLHYTNSRPVSTLSDSFQGPRLGMVHQALTLGISLPSIPTRPTAKRPSQAAFELIGRSGVSPTQEQREDIAKLDKLPTAIGISLGNYISAFLDFDQATRTAFEDVDLNKVEPGWKEIDDLMQTPEGRQELNQPATITALKKKTADIRRQWFPRLKPILLARWTLLMAAQDLANAIKAEPTAGVPAGPYLPPASGAASLNSQPDSPHAAQARHQSPTPAMDEGIQDGPSAHEPATPTPAAGLDQPVLRDSPVPLRLSAMAEPQSGPEENTASPNPKMEECPLSVSPALCIDLSENTDNEYKKNYALQIDNGGNEIYLNNAGGSNIRGTLGCHGAGALFDLSGNDEYRTPHKCGGNGGAANGAGFLVDMAGRDVYVAGTRGLKAFPGTDDPGKAFNGGAVQGVAFLYDMAGNDSYEVKGYDLLGINGGGTSGSQSVPGTGLLVDGTGDDSYIVGDREVDGICDLGTAIADCYTQGANGGGAHGGAGSLLDFGGNDAYKADYGGVNGGDMSDDGTGFLFDAWGNDSYRGSDEGVNGGGPGGFLFDRAGNDAYLAGRSQTNGGWGLLIDGGGLDLYRDASKLEPHPEDGQLSGSGRDVTLVPKGAGAQIDENSPSADLAITLSDSPDPVPAGRNLTYAIEVKNNGPHSRFEPGDPSKMCKSGIDPSTTYVVTAGCYPPGVDAGPDVSEEVVIVDELPPGVNFTQASPSSGSCSKSGRTLTCRMGDLANGQSATVDVVVTPHNPPGTVIFNRASVASSPSDPNHSTPDPEPANNAASVQTTVIEGPPSLSVFIADAPFVKEGGAGTQTTAPFQVSLSAPAEFPVKVDYVTQDGTASEGDYQRTVGTLEFASGQITKTIVVPVKGDDLSEADETFTAQLTRPQSVIIDNGQGIGTIADDDALPAISIEDAVVQEGDSGGTLAEFIVRLAAQSGQAVSIDYATADADATVDDNDYQAKTSNLTFAPGQTTGTLKVTANGDTRPEGDESFFVVLSNPQKAVIDRGRGSARIMNDDYDDLVVQKIDPASYSYQDGDRGSGGVFVSGHDAEHHSSGGSPGAQRIIQRAVGYVTRNKPSPKLLYVTGGGGIAQADGVSIPPCDANGNAARQLSGPQQVCQPTSQGTSVGAATGVAGMRAAGFPAFDIARAGGGADYKDLRTVDFAEYDAVVVSCYLDWGNLSQAELNVLNHRSPDVLRYVNGGGGLVAFEESGLNGQFGFLPFLRPSANLHQDEKEFKATSFGKSLGLTDEDVSANISHNIFTAASGFGIVDVDGQGRIVSLATRLRIGPEGAIPDEGSGDGQFDPLRDPDAPPRATTGGVTSQTPLLRNDPPTQPLPPRQEITKPDHAGVGRNPSHGQSTQKLAQPGAREQLQHQLQVRGQTQVQPGVQQSQHQSEPQLQTQASAMNEKQREARIQVARAEAPANRPGRAAGPSRRETHLASARQTSMPAGAAIGGIASLMLMVYGLARPKRQSARRDIVYVRKENVTRRASGPPPHRKR